MKRLAELTTAVRHLEEQARRGDSAQAQLNKMKAQMVSTCLLPFVKMKNEVQHVVQMMQHMFGQAVLKRYVTPGTVTVCSGAICKSVFSFICQKCGPSELVQHCELYPGMTGAIVERVLL